MTMNGCLQCNHVTKTMSVRTALPKKSCEGVLAAAHTSTASKEFLQVTGDDGQAQFQERPHLTTTSTGGRLFMLVAPGRMLRKRLRMCARSCAFTARASGPSCSLCGMSSTHIGSQMYLHRETQHHDDFLL